MSGINKSIMGFIKQSSKNLPIFNFNKKSDNGNNPGIPSNQTPVSQS
jgi:hypothetical protein